MQKKQLYLNITLILPDGRVLLKQDDESLSNRDLWTMTEELPLCSFDDTKNIYAFVNTTLFNVYKIGLFRGISENKINVNYSSDIETMQTRIIKPVVIKIKEQLSFKVPKTQRFVATRFNNLLYELSKDNAMKNHSLMCVHVMRALYNKGILLDERRTQTTTV